MDRQTGDSECNGGQINCPDLCEFISPVQQTIAQKITWPGHACADVDRMFFNVD